MKNKLLFASMMLFLSIVLFQSCHKHSDDTDTDPPVVTISSPTDNQAFQNGSIMNISGLVTDHSMHAIIVTITDTGTNSVLYSKEIEAHDLTSYNLNETWTVAITANTTANVKISAEDHSNLFGEKNILVQLKL